MSREAWGDPPDPEPQCCPNCGEQQHTDGCEVCELDKRRIAAEGETIRLRLLLQQAVVLFACRCTDSTTRDWLDRAEAATSKTPNVI